MKRLWSRRAVLLALAATACPKTPTIQAVARGNVTMPVRLGWRWPPGLSHRFRTVTTWEAGGRTTTRTEQWSYLALDLDPAGTMLLRGQLLGLGLSATEGGRPVAPATLKDARDRAIAHAQADVEVALRISGALVSCTAEGFANALPHHLLGLTLPSEPTTPGTTWDDPGLSLLLAQLVPPELPLRVDTRTRLLGLTAHSQEEAPDALAALLEHDTLVRTTDSGPVLRARGTTTWDTAPGAIGVRRLELRISPDPGFDGVPAGTLSIEFTREGRDAAAPAA